MHDDTKKIKKETYRLACDWLEHLREQENSLKVRWIEANEQIVIAKIMVERWKVLLNQK